MTDGGSEGPGAAGGDLVSEAAGNMRAVRDYLDGFYNEVEGWCFRQVWQSVQGVDEFQRRHGIDGPIAEIGVLEGKFFIGLMKTKRRAPNFAIDLFSLQQFNRDASGTGNLERFRSNIENSGESLDNVRILERDSMTLMPRDIEAIRAETGGFSLFSVNGGHDVDHVINDVEIAMQLTQPGGVIYLDDYYNANWPGVHEGMSKLYFTRAPRFVPLIFGCNKLALCHISWHAHYIDYLAEFTQANFPDTNFKRVERFGYDSLTALPDIENGAYCIER